MGMDYAHLQYARGVMKRKKSKQISNAKDKTVCHTEMQKHDQCYHRLFNLCVISDPWWCSKAFCHTEASEG